MDHPITKAPCGSVGATIAVTCADGACRVLFMYAQRFDKRGRVVWNAELTPEYVEQQIAKVYAAHPHYLPTQIWRFLPGEEAKHPYIGAWKDTGDGPLSYDMEKAREIHRALLRRDRALAFVELDAAYLRADEESDDAAKLAIATRKQLLRDAPQDPRIDEARSLEDLKQITLPE